MRPRRALLLIAAAALLWSSPLPRSAWAGAVVDTDGDLVPQPFDNCTTLANGPGDASNQVDSDEDGYGNRCDTDYDQNLVTSINDFANWLARFGQTCNRFLPDHLECEEKDHDGNGAITVADFSVYFSRFAAPPGNPGPTGLACAGTVPCKP